MRKLKWWQWVLIVFFGISILGAIFGDPEKRAAAKRAQQSRPVDPDAKFEAIAGSDVFAMTFELRADADAIAEAAREQCGKRKFCKVMGWVDPNFAGRAIPLTDREIERQVFDYSLNRNTGFERTLWDCRLWKRVKPDECLAR